MKSWWANSINLDRLVLHTNRAETFLWRSKLGHDEFSEHFNTVLKKHHGADFFNALWKAKPIFKADVLDDEETEKDDKAKSWELTNLAFEKWLRQITETKGFKDLKMKTVHDKNMAAATALTLHKQFQEATSTMKTIENLQQKILDDITLDETKTPDTLMLSALNNLSQEELTDKEKSVVEQAIEVTEEIIEAAEELNAVFGSGQGGGDGAGAGIGDEASESTGNMVIAGELSNKVQRDKIIKLLEIAGRMFRIFEDHRKSGIYQSSVPIEVTLGNDVEKVVSDELALLSEPETELLFDYKFATSTLTQYNPLEKQPEGKGPIVVCVDYSGSMNGNPLDHALAFYMAIAREAKRQRRDVAFLPFGDRAVDPIHIESIPQIVNSVLRSYRTGWGTDFQKPLDKVVKLLESKRSEDTPFKEADVIFITDGHAYLPNPWLDDFAAAKERLSFKMLGVLIGGMYMRDNHSDGRLHDSALIVHSINNLEWVGKCADLVGGITEA